MTNPESIYQYAIMTR